jgi:AbrB family looped-hinge helix DNA binding protein
MRTTIDAAGRVGIPASLRKKAGFRPGAELEIFVDDLALRIERVARRPHLIRAGSRLVACPQANAAVLPFVDITALIEEERGRRRR